MEEFCGVIYPKSESFFPESNTFTFNSSLDHIVKPFGSPLTPKKLKVPKKFLIQRKPVQMIQQNNDKNASANSFLFKMLPFNRNDETCNTPVEIISSSLEDIPKIDTNSEKETEEQPKIESIEELLKIKTLENELLQLKLKLAEHTNANNINIQESYYKHSIQMFNNLQSSNQLIIQMVINLQREMDDVRNAVKELTQVNLRNSRKQYLQDENMPNISLEPHSVLKQPSVGNLFEFGDSPIKLINNCHNETTENNTLKSLSVVKPNHESEMDQTIKNLTQQINNKKNIISRQSLSNLENSIKIDIAKLQHSAHSNPIVQRAIDDKESHNKSVVNKWQCKFCSFYNFNRFRTCKICRQSNSQLIPIKSINVHDDEQEVNAEIKMNWTCDCCTYINNIDSSVCNMCCNSKDTVHFSL